MTINDHGSVETETLPILNNLQNNSNVVSRGGKPILARELIDLKSCLNIKLNILSERWSLPSEQLLELSANIS